MPLSPDNQDNIERLKQEIYQPGAPAARLRRNRLTPLSGASKTSWGDEKRKTHTSGGNSSHWWVRILVISIIFFLAAAAFGFWVSLRGGNIVSPDKIDITIAGPATVRAGEAISLQVVVANNNASNLESADLVINFPLGTRSPERDREVPNLRLPLGGIESGASINQTVKAAVFGEPGVEQKINFTVEYRIVGSNAIFDKSSSYSFTINTAPLLLKVDLPTEAAAHEALTFTVEVAAEAEGQVDDVIVVADYPPGFTFGDSTPEPAYSDNIWRLGDLPAGSKRKISISGVMAGEDKDERSFRFVAGLADKKSEHQIAVPYNTITRAVTITRPGVALDFSLNGDTRSLEYVANSEDTLRAEISWINNLPTEIKDAEIEVRIDGSVLNQNSVSSAGGFYQSGDKKIIWTKRTDDDLSEIAAGEKGKIGFSFASLPLVVSGKSSPLSPEITMSVSFRGKRVPSGEESTEVEATFARSVKINSVFQLAAGASYSGGPFNNSGPLPPEVGKKTSYTISWSVINSSNVVREAQVRATLPANVEWLGQVAPATEKITFDQASGEVVWDLGVVEAGRGIGTPAREASFQVSLLPSISQVGELPVLVSTPTLSGTDSFTGSKLTSTKNTLNTNISGDPAHGSGGGRVVP